MPISPIVLSRRHAELGRIRLGQKNPERGFPMKLSSFRFTSPSESYIRDLAELYGGEVRPWDNNGKPEFEVFTTASSMPVYVVKGGLSQWMETWVGGGIVHRCDGEKQADGTPCDPDEWIEVREKGKQKKLYVHREAKPTTRLSVMLPELDAIGVWRMESKGWNAAAEIPAVAELAQFVGDLVPAVLNLVERRTVKDGQTSRFVVPVLDLRIGQARLREIVNQVSNGAGELAGPSAGQPAANEAPATSSPAAGPEAAPSVKVPTPEQIAAMDVHTLRRSVDYLMRHGLGEHPATHAARKRIDFLEDHEDDPTIPGTSASQPVANPDGTYDAEIVEETPTSTVAAGQPDPDVVWQQIIAHAGTLGWTTDQVHADFTASMGMPAGEASGAELAAYLRQMQTGEQVPA